MVDGLCSTSPCQSNPSGICWGGTGSGAFSAESFSVSSRSNCEGYVSAMKQASPMGGRRLQLNNASETQNNTNSTNHRALQSTGSADSMRNRAHGKLHSRNPRTVPLVVSHMAMPSRVQHGCREQQPSWVRFWTVLKVTAGHKGSRISLRETHLTRLVACEWALLSRINFSTTMSK